jgi:hypothetical protein
MATPVKPDPRRATYANNQGGIHAMPRDGSQPGDRAAPATGARRTVVSRVPSYAKDTAAAPLPSSGIVGTAAAPSPSSINPIKMPATGMQQTRTPVRPAMVPQAPAGSAQDSVNAARAKLAEVGPGYVGSIYGKPGSYTEARPAPTPVRPSFSAGGPVRQTPGASLPVQPITPPAPQQTEAANPLTGDRNGQMEDTTAAIQDPARAVGFSSRGGGNPRGTDVMPGGANTGGTGVYARTFASPSSAQVYDQYVRRLFGAQSQDTE